MVKQPSMTNVPPFDATKKQQIKYLKQQIKELEQQKKCYDKMILDRKIKIKKLKRIKN